MKQISIKKCSNTKGVTLVALVVTIVVLLILASITIATLTGEEGTIKKAKETAQETKETEEEENRIIEDIYNTMRDNPRENNPEEDKLPATNPSLGAYTGDYDGKPHKITITMPTEETGGTILYSTDQETWSEEPPTRTNYGVTTVYVKVQGDDKHFNTEIISSTITINRSKTATTSALANLVYNGKEQTGITGENVEFSGEFKAINQGTYTAIVIPEQNYAWEDGTVAEKTVNWSIVAKPVAVNWGETTTFEYDGTAKAPTAIVTSPIEGETINIERTTASNAGTHTSTASIESVTGGQARKENYILTGNTKQFTIEQIVVAIPKANTGLIYNGKEQIGVAGGTNYVVTNGTATNAGTYTAKVTLANTNYKWSDGTTGIKNISFTIDKITPTLYVEITGNNFLGQTLTAEVTTNSPGALTYEWRDFTTSAIVGSDNTVTLDSSSLVDHTIGCTVNVAETTNYKSIDTFNYSNNGWDTVCKKPPHTGYSPTINGKSLNSVNDIYRGDIVAIAGIRIF